MEHETWSHPLGMIRRIPERCIWAITNRCNLRCIHCETESGVAHPNELSWRDMQRTARELAALGCREVNVSGGEPLLSPHWERLCRLLAELGIFVNLVTNGTLLDEPTLERAQRAGVSGLGISIDGLRETHDRTRVAPRDAPLQAFERTLAAVRRAVGRIPVGIITQVNQENLIELPALGELLRSLGVARWQLQLVLPCGRLRDLERPYVLAPEQLLELSTFIVSARRSGKVPPLEVTDTIGYFSRDELEIRSRTLPLVWFGCIAGVRLVSITCDGKVRGCSGLPAEFDAGSLHDHSLEEIWRDPGRFSFLTQFAPEALSGGCKRCEMGPLCRAGCPALAYYTTGSIRENRHCLRLVETSTTPKAN